MHDPSVTCAATAARRGGPMELAAALRASRADTLATFAAWQRQLPELQVPLRAELNPPLWELGHVGWFQERWLLRLAQRTLGWDADPYAALAPPLRRDADALYDSGTVPHDSRWALPLPSAAQTQADLAQQLQAALALLETAGADDRALYFFRLALLHEDMHHEAALYMAQSLGIAIADARWQASTLAPPGPPVTLAPGEWIPGNGAGEGFAFDNELGAHPVMLGETSIDAQVLRWAEFLPFAEEGGYADARWWSEAGWQWCVDANAVAPRYLRRDGAAWLQWRHGQWRALDLSEAAVHLTLHEAQAWCLWAGRSLPNEAQWERAAVTRPEAFHWGEVWEWTASPFAPYPGFRAHPYRDYSAPWFDGRPVVRGASFMTQPRMRHLRYRNFFIPSRNDVPIGFRTCTCTLLSSSPSPSGRGLG